MFGTWTVSAVGFSDHPTCGQTVLNGSLQVQQRLPNKLFEMYKGTVESQISYASCDDPMGEVVNATLTVQGNVVTISYDNSSWSPDLLKRVGDVMEGWDSKEVRSRWVKVAGASDSTRAAEAQKNISQTMYEQASDQIRAEIVAQGYDETDAENRLREFFDAAAACEVGSLMISAAEQGLSFYELVNLIDTGSIGLMNSDLQEAFDVKPFNARMRQCNDDIYGDYGLTLATNE